MRLPLLTTEANNDMKFKSTFTIGIIVAILGFAAMAQDRVYRRVVQGMHIDYAFWDSKEELGFRLRTSIPTQDPCFKEFYKLTKSVENGVILFTTDKKIAGCLNQRFMFPDGDLSMGFQQNASVDNTFTQAIEKIDELKARPQGGTPLILKK